MHPTTPAPQDLALVRLELRATPALDAHRLLAALATLRDEGYARLVIDGRAPLACPWLLRLVAGAKMQGWQVLLHSGPEGLHARHATVLQLLDGLTLSSDARGAVDRLAAALHLAAELGRPAEAALALPFEHLARLPDLAELLARQGAQALHVALARSTLPLAIDALRAQRARLHLTALALREHLSMPVHSALTPAQALAPHRSAQLVQAVRPGRPLADAIDVLEITDAGVLLPFSSGVSRGYALGTLEDCQPIGIARYKAERLPALVQLLARAVEQLATLPGLVDWAEHLAHLSHVPQAYVPGQTPAPRPLQPSGLAPLASQSSPANEETARAA
jgi:hypothetical protein